MYIILRVKVPNSPGSGKSIAEHQGVFCEEGAEGRCKQIFEPTYRNFIRLGKRIRVQHNSKSNSYTESYKVNEAVT